MASRETKEQYVGRILCLHPELGVTAGMTAFVLPSGRRRFIEPCGPECDFEECTGWRAPVLESEEHLCVR